MTTRVVFKDRGPFPTAELFWTTREEHDDEKSCPEAPVYIFGNLADAEPRMFRIHMCFLCAFSRKEGITDILVWCGFLERRETIGSSSQIFWKTQEVECDTKDWMCCQWYLCPTTQFRGAAHISSRDAFRYQWDKPCTHLTHQLVDVIFKITARHCGHMFAVVPFR